MLPILRFPIRLLKGAILTSWIVALLGLTLLAISSQGSRQLLKLADRLFAKNEVLTWEPQCYLPGEYLQRYLVNHTDPPPLWSILDAMNDRWAEPDPQCQKEDFESQVASYMRYFVIFKKVHSHLDGLAETGIEANSNQTPLSLPLSILPPELRPPGAEKSVEIPSHARIWIEQEHQRLARQESQAALIDTFLLVTVIGAFGSLIFLTREYILDRAEASGMGVASYIYRPVLGIFLAMAMFVLDMLAHALVSKSSFLEIRAETLYVLAMGAGLLSEQAYAAVSYRVAQALKKYQDEGEPSGTSGETPLRTSDEISSGTSGETPSGTSDETPSGTSDETPSGTLPLARLPEAPAAPKAPEANASAPTESTKG